MKKHLINALLFTFLLPNLLFCQALELGTLSSFEAYTGLGAATNSGTFSGDVGTNNGIVSGFVSPSFTGVIYNSDTVTVQARFDLLKVYIHLNDVFVTYPGTHAPAFGSGETITPGVYSIAGAGSLAGTITLDGGGDPDAVFILKFGGAFTTAVGSTVVLSNGTRACNIFWIAEGAISVGASSVLKGALFSHPGALTLGANCNIEGRMFASEGAITIGAGSVAVIPTGPITIPATCSAACSSAPSLDVLGSIEGFALFTSDGAVSNTATSGIIGDIGSNLGAITGFGTSTLIGAMYTADAITAQAKTDLDLAYSQLSLLPNTELGHAPAFGSGETLNEGVYYIGGAGSLAGTITLDGQNNPNAVFVFKFNGAFSAAAQSKVILANDTRRCNVFWISEGAANIGAFSYMKGTVLAHGGACSMAANGNLEGRLLSTAGAIGFSTGVVYTHPLCVQSSILPIELLSFTAKINNANIQLDWVTSTEHNNDYFNVERSVDIVNFTSIDKINGAGNSIQTLSYSIIDNEPIEGISYYRLKQTDYNGTTSYSSNIAVEFNYKNHFIVEVYPNPFSNETVFHTSENLKNASLIVYNSNSEIVKELANIAGHSFTLNCKNLNRGVYFTSLSQNGVIISTDKLVIK
ncbi:MAG: hypothetical protein ACJASQ_002051 [Crocinitomicaceae bacterium]|jgi:hypothetical protein